MPGARAKQHFPPGFLGRLKPHSLEALYRRSKRDAFFQHPRAMIELREAVEIVREVANHQAARPSEIGDELVCETPPGTKAGDFVALGREGRWQCHAISDNGRRAKFVRVS